MARTNTPTNYALTTPPEAQSDDETYIMVYQGKGKHFSDEDNVGSFGALGGCTNVAIRTRTGWYMAHVDAITQNTNPAVFADNLRYSHMEGAQVFLTKNSASQQTGDQIMSHIPKDKEVVFGEDTGSLKVDRGKVTFDVAPTKKVDPKELETEEQILVHAARKTAKMFEEKGGFKKRPAAPGSNFYFNAKEWEWLPL